MRGPLGGGAPRPPHPSRRLSAARTAAEAACGLQSAARAGRAPGKSPARAGYAKAARAGRPEPARVTLQRQVPVVAARACIEPVCFTDWPATVFGCGPVTTSPVRSPGMRWRCLVTSTAAG
jgi:hypothetical protein